MASKRPTTAQIRARQRKIIEGMGTAALEGKRSQYVKSAAKQLGVTPRELERFIDRKPQEVRKTYSRSKTAQKLYGEATPRELKSRLGLKTQPKRFEYEPQRTAEYRIFSSYAGFTPEEGEMMRTRIEYGLKVANLYYEGQIAKLEWMRWTRSQGLPRSGRAIQLLYKNRKISRQLYEDAHTVAEVVYGVRNTYSRW